MLVNLLLNRRSVRRFKDKEVEREKVEAIVKGALTSPSGRDLRPGEIIVVEDKESLDRLAKARGRVSQLIGGAPLAFVIIGDTRESTTWLSDTAIMAIIVQLLGEDQGLKSCWVHVKNRKSDDGSSTEDNVREILNIPKYYTPHCVIAMGYPDESKVAYKEEDLDFNRVHWGKF